MAKVQFNKRAKTDLIVIHCSATKPTMDIGLREIRQWHVQQGWLDVGYHFIIRRNGQVETGRPQDVVGSHVKGHNSDSIGICLVGGIDSAGKPEDNFTDAQWTALDGLVWEASKVWYPEARICGHRDLDSGKACPSFDVASWLNSRTKN
ncbi:peptidoglycan recognition protein family protein [Pseudomonas asplenii]|uniref:peptidoglycan recognition protein family protein n=1 Tax=Pseudomonas asplenii TaxID=53407 RepID=UPI0006B48ED9|nr:N-acetylmuramoyl-L-alanine amidase [Pseudomonas fuscovaginae]